MKKKMQAVQREFLNGTVQVQNYVKLARDTFQRVRQEQPYTNRNILIDTVIEASFAHYCKDVHNDDGSLFKACRKDFITNAFVSEGYKKRMEDLK